MCASRTKIRGILAVSERPKYSLRTAIVLLGFIAQINVRARAQAVEPTESPTRAPVLTLNVSLMHWSEKKSHLTGVNAYMSVCSFEDSIRNDTKCFGGAHRWAGYTNMVRAEKEGTLPHVVILVDSGDAVVGTTHYTQGLLGAFDMQFFNSLPVDVYVPNNMELHEGIEHLKLTLERLDRSIDVIISNADWSHTPLNTSRLKRWAVREYNGVQIGFVGFIRADAHVVLPTLSPDFVINPLGLGVAAEISRAVHEMQAAHPACKAVVLIGRSDGGVEFEDVLRTVPEVSVGLSSDAFDFRSDDAFGPLPTSAEVVKPFSTLSVFGRPRFFSRTSQFGSGMGHLWMALDAGGEVREVGGGHVLLSKDIPADPLAVQALSQMQEQLDQVGLTPIGVLANDVYAARGNPADPSTWPGCRAHDCPMGRAVADSYSAFCLRRFPRQPCDFSIVNGGSIRASMKMSTNNGTVTVADTQLVLPWQDHLVVLDIQGQHVLRMMQRMAFAQQIKLASSGSFHASFAQVDAHMRYVYNPEAATEEESIVMVQVMEQGEWQPLRPSRSYRVVLSNFLASGGDGYSEFKDFGLVVLAMGVLDSKSLEDHIRASQPGLFSVPTREALLGCTGMNAHSVYAQWPPTAEHCRIIQSSVEVLQACGPGQYSEVVDNKQTCRECPPGSFSEAGDNDFADEAACTPCPAGTFASEPGSVVCVSCDAKGAYFQSMAGQSYCTPCPEGTIRLLNSPALSIDECVCKEGRHNVDGALHGAECAVCPHGAVCGGHSLSARSNVRPFPKPGFWADPESPVQFSECGRDLCTGGSNFTCAAAMRSSMHSNRMCMGVQEGYSNVANFFYWKCPGGYQSAAAAAVTVCVEACVIYVFFWTRGVLFQYSPIDVLFKNLRLMSIISSFKLRWSPALTNIFVALKFSVFSVDITQPNCIMPWSFRHSFAAQHLLLLVLCLGHWVVLLPKALLHMTRTSASWRDTLLASHGALAGAFDHAVAATLKGYTMCYVAVSSVVLLAFKCHHFPDGNRYLTADPSIQCGTAEHWELMVPAACMLPVLAAGPLFIALTTTRMTSPNDQTNLQRYGGLYKNKMPKYQWWEAIILLKFAVVVALQVSLMEHPLWQALITVWINAVHLGATMHCRPYIKPDINWLESILIGIGLLFPVAGTMFYSKEFEHEDQLVDVLRVGFGVAILATASTFVTILDEARAKLVNMKLRTRVATEMHRLITSSERHEFVSERLHDLHAMMEFMGVEGREELLIETATPKASESAAFGHQSLGDSAQLHSWGRMRALKTDVKVNARTAIQELALTELHQTIKGTTFYRWAHACSDLAELDLCFAVDECVAPYFADNAVASIYDTTPHAEFWRRVVLSFPRTISWLTTTSQAQAAVAKEAFAKLSRTNFPTTTDLAVLPEDIFSPEDRAAVLHFMCIRQQDALKSTSGRSLLASDQPDPTNQLMVLRPLDQQRRCFVELIQKMDATRKQSRDIFDVISGIMGFSATRVGALPSDIGGGEG